MDLRTPLAGFLHLIGAFLAIPALVILIVKGVDSPWKIVSFSIYGTTLFLLYTFSTLYHWLPKKTGGRYQIFRKLDHLAIYALIAGTYTPFCLVTLRGAWGWTLFGISWGLAITAITLQAIYINLPRWLTTTFYIIMGWLVIVVFKPLLAALPIQGFLLFLSGGLVYSVGGIIYTIRKPNFSRAFGYHELWHTLVLIASFLHFLVILIYLA
ncbi:hemolysin III family protein [Candidatus Margulisiibacteriota bacterium]